MVPDTFVFLHLCVPLCSRDYLTGNAGRDWFLANSALDVLTDQAVDEVFTHIDGWLGA